jgi:hypothetical protein
MSNIRNMPLALILTAALALTGRCRTPVLV